MSIERANDHPTHESSGNTITSLAAPARGASEVALFRTELPPGGALPRHRHDHIDVFTVERGGGTVQVGDERAAVVVGDSVVIPSAPGITWTPAPTAQRSPSRCLAARN